MPAKPELTGKELVERARALQPLVRSFAERADAERRLPIELVRELASAGLFRIAAARSCGGIEADPREQILAIEAISEADGAAGWTLMIGIECVAWPARFCVPTWPKGDREAPEVVFWRAEPGRATPVAGGYRVTGQWPFASGCHNAGWFWGQCMVTTDGGELAKSEGGAPILREALIPCSDFEILDTWHVAGCAARAAMTSRSRTCSCPTASPRT
jgi:alkylation response protein AidB-like acyl-CoA dehydrogenase